MGEFFTPVTKPVARKQYKCDTCYAKIEPGTKYARWSGRYDGAFFTCTVHLPCYAAAAEEYNGYDDDLFQPSNYNTDEALEFYHAAGVLAEALPYLRTVMDFTDTPMDGKTDAELVAYFDEQARILLEKDLERIARHFHIHKWPFDRLDARLREVVMKQGLVGRDGQLTEKGQALAAQAKPHNTYRAIVAHRA